MAIRTISTKAPEIEADTVVVAVYSEGGFTHPAALVDRATGGRISGLMEAGEITGKRNETVALMVPPGVKAGQILVLGLGNRDQLDRGVVARAAGSAAKRLADRPRSSVAFCLSDEWSDELTEAAVAGAVAGYYGQDMYRHKKRVFPPDELYWSSKSSGLGTGQKLGEAINFIRRLVNAGPHELHPESLATQISQMARVSGIEAEVWNPVRLKTENCHALLAVSQGSAREPRLVILKYNGAGEDAPTLALVGKGVTFDSGGLSLKTSDGMKSMKCDMAGAATVAGAIRAIGHLRLPVNVIGVMGLVENMTGPSAYKLGDVITTRQGTTVEVLNTDAEGRLVLADCLDVARTMGASRIIDVATLTGACVVALGGDVTGMMTNNQAWCDQVRAGFTTAGELAWQLPMYDVFDDLIVSEVADIRNTGKTREGGAITAAKFLAHFVGDIPWTHLDIAGTAFRDTAKPWLDAGATGEGLRALIEVARNFRVDDEPVVFQQE